MKVQLIQYDSPWPNHALMKLSGYHKALGDEVRLFKGKCNKWGDRQYRSILYKWGKGGLPGWGINGGPGWDPGVCLSLEVEQARPDYSIYPKNIASWGYTFKHCGRGCEFCIVNKMPGNKDKKHYSIYDFYDKKFDEIILLNNNTFYDPSWRVTFQEIWKEGLSVFDMNGYDCRLLDKEKVDYMNRTKWSKGVHFAYDRSEDRESIEKGLRLICDTSLKGKCSFYVMLGWKYSHEQDMERINLLRDYGVAVIGLQFNKNDPWSRRVKRWTMNRRIFFAVKYGDFLDGMELRVSKMSESELLQYKCESMFRPGGRRLVRR